MSTDMDMGVGGSGTCLGVGGRQGDSLVPLTKEDAGDIGHTGGRVEHHSTAPLTEQDWTCHSVEHPNPQQGEGILFKDPTRLPPHSPREQSNGRAQQIQHHSGNRSGNATMRWTHTPRNMHYRAALIPLVCSCNRVEG